MTDPSQIPSDESAPGLPREVRMVALTALRDHPSNPKSHADDAISGSVARFGYVEPIVVDERTGYTISGHGRTAALRRAFDADPTNPPEGVEVNKRGAWFVPVVTGWRSANDAEARAALIALNRTGELGGWNDTVLLDLLDDLSQFDSGLDGIGFDMSDLDDLTARLQEAPAPIDQGPNTRETPSMTDYRERYEEQGRRLIVLDYDHEEYPLVTARLRAARAEFGVESNADAIAALIADRYPDALPAAEDTPREPGDQYDYADPEPSTGD